MRRTLQSAGATRGTLPNEVGILPDVRGKVLTLVRTARETSRHRSMETYQNRVPAKQCSWESCNLVRILECGEHVSGPIDCSNDESKSTKVESLETFSDGMKIAVLASHAPESVRKVVGQIGSRPSEWKQHGGAPEPVRVCSVWSNLRQGVK